MIRRSKKCWRGLRYEDMWKRDISWTKAFKATRRHLNRQPLVRYSNMSAVLALMLHDSIVQNLAAGNGNGAYMVRHKKIGRGKRNIDSTRKDRRFQSKVVGSRLESERKQVEH